MSSQRREFLRIGAMALGGLFAGGLLGGCAARRQEPRRFYLPRYRTVAHEIIDIQSDHPESSGQDPHVLLDQLLDVTIEELTPLLAPADDPRHAALAVLSRIEAVLHRCGFEYESVRLLGDGLRRRELNCDGLSAYYLSVGEVLGLPIRMVRAPAHTFVRWLLPDGGYINWETTTGKESTDAYYIERLNISPASIGPTALRSLDVRSNRLAILANAYVNDGVKWLEKSEVHRAIASFERAASNDLNYETPRYNLAVANFRLGRYEKAIAWCEQVVRLNPNHAKTHAIMADAYSRLGRVAMGRMHRLRVLEIDPGYYGRKPV